MSTSATLAILFCGVALAALFFQRIPAVLPAFAAIVCARAGDSPAVTTGQLAFWAAATALTVALRIILPAKVNTSHAGVPYMGAGAIAGGAIGLATATMAGVVLATIGCTFFALAAYWRTPAGRARLGTAFVPVLNYYAAKALPMTVATAQIALALAPLAARQ